jgi:hypothetical protein
LQGHPNPGQQFREDAPYTANNRLAAKTELCIGMAMFIRSTPWARA